MLKCQQGDSNVVLSLYTGRQAEERKKTKRKKYHLTSWLVEVKVTGVATETCGQPIGQEREV